MYGFLPQTAQYALRSLVCVAEAKGEPVRSVDIAEVANVPLPYLSKVLRLLVEAGLLSSQRGHGGGFRLTRDPLEIRFLDVMRAVGVDPTSGPCMFGWDECDAHAPCPLHGAKADFNQRLREWGARTTLADAGPVVRRTKLENPGTP
jgi:Rrf2 family nitric oxide-sensitive transcriptional repressor